MNKILLFCLAAVLNAGCVLNMSMVHTEGTASDVIDDTATSETDVSPVVSLPTAI